MEMDDDEDGGSDDDQDVDAIRGDVKDDRIFKASRGILSRIIRGS